MHRVPWLYVEDYYCSYVFLLTYSIKKENKSLNQLAKELYFILNNESKPGKKRVDERTIGSIKYKIRNIKYEVEQLNSSGANRIVLSCNFKSKKHISKNNQRAIFEAKENLNIK